MKAVRATLVGVILLNLALLAAEGPLRATLSRYELSVKRQELRKLASEHRVLLREAAEARRPDRVAARAKAMGVELRIMDQENLASAAGQIPATRGPAQAPAPRR